MARDALVMTYRQRGGIDQGDAGAATFAAVQIATQGHQRPRHQLDKATIADQVREVGAQMHRDILSVVVFEIPVVAAVEIHDDGHDFAQAQLTLAPPLALAVLEQTLRVDWLKDLAKIIDIAEHGDKRAHGDLRKVGADCWHNQLPYARPYGLATPSCLSRIEVRIGWDPVIAHADRNSIDHATFRAHCSFPPGFLG